MKSVISMLNKKLYTSLYRVSPYEFPFPDFQNSSDMNSSRGIVNANKVKIWMFTDISKIRSDIHKRDAMQRQKFSKSYSGCMMTKVLYNVN